MTNFYTTKLTDKEICKINKYIKTKITVGNRTLKQNSLFNCKNKSIIEEHEYGNSQDFTC
jgi:hypothetical protein